MENLVFVYLISSLFSGKPKRKRRKQPVIGGGAEVSGEEILSSIGVALVVVESAAIIALDGPRVRGDGAIVV